MRPDKIALTGLILFGCAFAASDTFADAPSSASARQRRIATVDQPAEVLMSDDLAHLAVIDRHGGKQRLTIDGKTGLETDALQFVEHHGLLLDGGGIPVLYARAEHGRWRLVVHGVAGPECDAWTDLTYCDSGQTAIAYTAVDILRKAFVAVDGQPGPTYADVSCPALSPDHTRIAYVACIGQGPQRKCIPIIDGHAGPEYDEIAIPSSGNWNVFSADNKHTAYAARLGLKWRVVADGQPGPEYDQIASDSLAFSSDGGHEAYAAMSGSRWCVVLDGRPGRLYDGIGPGQIRFLAGAKEIAYTALAGSKWLAIIGDQPQIPYDEIADLIVSLDGRHVAFVGRSGEKWQAIVDGQRGLEYDQIGPPDHERFWASADGKRLAYAARLGSKWRVVVDGRPGAECDEIQLDEPPFYFSPDGKRTAYTARIGAKWYVVIDGQPGLPCDQVERGSFEFSDDGVRTAYVGRRDGKAQVVVDNQPGSKYDDVDASSRIFTLHGARVAYAAQRDEKWRVVINGVEGPKYDDVSELLYSPDGRRLAYVAGRIVNDFSRDQSLVVDGHAGPWNRRIGNLSFFCGSSAHVSSAQFEHSSETDGGKPALGHDNIYGVVFSSDGKHIAYPAGTSDEARIINDGNSGPAYREIGAPVFSSDGKRLAYVATVGERDEGKAVMVIDGQPGPVYEKVELPVGRGASCFSPDGKHTIYGGRKAAKWHVVVDGREGPACENAFFGPGAVTSYHQPAAFASWYSVQWSGEKNKPLAPVYDQFSFRPLFFGGDAVHVAYVGIVDTRARVSVVVDGASGPKYDQVGKPVLSSDGRRAAYIASRGQGSDRKFMAIIDGRKSPEYDEVPLNRGGEWEPFSVKGQHSAYMARSGPKWLAIIDGKPGPEYDEIDPAGVGSWGSFFSADGSRTAYFARRKGKWRAVIDGREGPEFDHFDDFLPLAFSPDGNHVAYIAQWGQGPRRKYRAIIDGLQGSEYETKWVAGVVFSPDSRRTAYVGQRDGKQFVVLDGKELAPHDAVDGIRLLFSPDSRRLAYIAERGEDGAQKAHFVVDGREGPEHGDHIWDIRFSPDGKHVAYIAINGHWQDSSHTEQLVVDGNEGPAVGEVYLSAIYWSSDSQHLAYVARDHRREWVVLNGKAQAKYVSVSDVSFSPDGKHLAYSARGDRGIGSIVVRDGQPGPKFDEIESLPFEACKNLFTPDSRHVFYQARKGGKRVVVLDSQAGNEYDSVLGTWLQLNGSVKQKRTMWPLRLLPDGAIQYPALTAGNPAKLYIVTQSAAAESATAPR